MYAQLTGGQASGVTDHDFTSGTAKGYGDAFTMAII
jgi:hypothetical protein